MDGSQSLPQNATPPPYAPSGLAREILTSPKQALFRVNLNGEIVVLPRDTFATLYHCLNETAGGDLELWVETNHFMWMRAALPAGGLFLDVGSATGTIALPMARHHGGNVRVVAMEPAHTAHALLTEAVALNYFRNIEIVDKAVSSQPGETLFAECPADLTGVTPWLPEASCLHNPNSDYRAQAYPVAVTTLDALSAQYGAGQKVDVVKIDVEGFECDVLDGARRMLAFDRPSLAIDIHDDPRTGVCTDAGVRERLEPIGYSCERMAHVLTCSPT